MNTSKKQLIVILKINGFKVDDKIPSIKFYGCFLDQTKGIENLKRVPIKRGFDYQAKHIKLLKKINTETFTEVTPTPAEKEAIKDLYEFRIINIGCISNKKEEKSVYSLKLNKIFKRVR